MSVISFDVGIKNLAFCLLKNLPNEKYELLGWDNVNLLSNSTDPPPPSKIVCYTCKSKATHQSGEVNSCALHSVRPVLTDLSGNKLLKIPSTNELYKLLLSKEPTAKKSLKKDAIIEGLKKYYAFPLQCVKPIKVSNFDLSYFHDSIRALVLKHKEDWLQVSEICIENQPAFKNPQMKSIQILLFATLRDILRTDTQEPPPIRLVHASQKVKGKATGDDGYKERKKGSEDRVTAAITSAAILDTNNLIRKFQGASKKNDLADAFCMCLDALSRLCVKES